MNAKSKYMPQPTSNRTTYVLGGIALVVIAAIVIIGVVWSSNRNQAHNAGYGTVKSGAVTAHLEQDGSVLLGKPNAAKTIDVFEDPMCPYCGAMEQHDGQEIAQAVDDGKLAVHYHLLNFLDEGSASKTYSTRAIAATQCIADTGNGPAYAKFHSELFSADVQPEEGGSSDHSNADLAKLAKQAGASDAAAQCISSGSKVQAASQEAGAAKQQMAKLGGQGTPSVFEGTTKIDTQSGDWVADLTK